ncbi:hypothetical protein SAMN05216223_107258 [Actinacidiphila yanglinensis]|uniref:Uncharacterized protein n=1 Tax=Actinacidiphila yanglinensis TaxID=310779 RepID=A0A1H6BUL1_9ACTN|nr:hypothetical protein SAMN05216223_107258 [Actinacidiphila yanglinensis]
MAFMLSPIVFTGPFTRRLLSSSDRSGLLLRSLLFGPRTLLLFTAFTVGLLAFTGLRALLARGLLAGGFPVGLLTRHAGFMLATCGKFRRSRIPLLPRTPLGTLFGLPLSTFGSLAFGLALLAGPLDLGLPLCLLVNSLFTAFTVDARQGRGERAPVGQRRLRRDDQQRGRDQVNTHPDSVAVQRAVTDVQGEGEQSGQPPQHYGPRAAVPVQPGQGGIQSHHDDDSGIDH